MFFSLNSLLNAQNEKKIEIGINGNYFNFDHVQNNNEINSEGTKDYRQYSINMFLNQNIAESRSFFHINIHRSNNVIEEQTQHAVNNNTIETVNDQQYNNRIGLYFGLGKNLISRSKFRLQVLSRIGYLYTEESKNYYRIFGSADLEDESIQLRPEMNTISLQTELKIGYNVYKNLYVSAGFVTDFFYEYQKGQQKHKTISYNGPSGTIVEEQIVNVKSESFIFRPFQGFVGLSVRL